MQRQLAAHRHPALMKIERHERRHRGGTDPSPSSNNSFLHGYDFALHPTDDGEYVPSFSAEFLPPASRPPRGTSRRSEGDAEKFLREKFGDSERFLRERFGERYAVDGDVGMSGQLSLVLVDHTRGKVTPLRPVYCNPRLLLAGAGELEGGDLPVLIDPGDTAGKTAKTTPTASSVPAPPPAPPLPAAATAAKRGETRTDSDQNIPSSSGTVANASTQKASKVSPKGSDSGVTTSTRPASPPVNTCHHQRNREGGSKGHSDTSKTREGTSRNREGTSRSRERTKGRGDAKKTQDSTKTQDSDRSRVRKNAEVGVPRLQAEGSGGRHVEAQVVMKNPGDTAPTGRRGKKSGGAANIQDGIFSNVRLWRGGEKLYGKRGGKRKGKWARAGGLKRRQGFMGKESMVGNMSRGMNVAFYGTEGK